MNILRRLPAEAQLGAPEGTFPALFAITNLGEL
jgi:hypothetical protein